MLEKKDFLPSDNLERKITSKERKEFIKKFSKPIVAALASVMVSTSSAQDIDISKLPKYASVDCKKYGIFQICVGKNKRDWDSHYDTDYYERYNRQVPDIETTTLKGIEHLNVIDGKLYLQGYDFDLVSAQEILPSEKFLKENDLDEVIIRIDNAIFKAHPKFLKLNFSRDGKKGVFGYHMDKSLTLVYVPYLDKIRVIGVIDNIAGFIETAPRDYDVLSSIENKRKIYYYTAKLLGCNNSCRYKRSFNGDVYFYSNGRLVGFVQDMGDKKLIVKNNRVIGKIIDHGKKVILLDNKDRIIYISSGFKNLDIKIPEIKAHIKLQINN